MSNITSYLRGGQYNYQEWKRFEASNSSNASEVSGASNASNASNASTASSVSGASGAVFEYGSVVNLNIEQVLELFREGNLTVDEMDKWIDANDRDISNFSYRKTSSLITYKFTYKGTDYSVSCTPEASKSQLDNKFQRTFSKGQIESYKERYELSDNEIAKYFVLASFNGSQEFYAINPKSKIKDVATLETEFKQLKTAKDAEEAKAAEEAEAARASKAKATSLEDRVKAALEKQYELSLVKCDKYENERGRIVAIDNDYNLYDFDTAQDKFVKRKKEDLVNYILGTKCNLAGDPFNITDVVRLINRELALEKDKNAFIEEYKKTLAEFNGYQYRGTTYGNNSFATGKDKKTYMYNNSTKEYVLDRDFDIVTVAEKQKLHYAGNGKAYDNDENAWEYRSSSNKFEKVSSGNGPGSDDIGVPGFEGGPSRVKVTPAAKPVEVTVNVPDDPSIITPVDDRVEPIPIIQEELRTERLEIPKYPKPDPHIAEKTIIGTVSADKIEQYHAIENMFAEGTLSLDEALRKVGGWLNGKPEVIDGVYVAHYQVGNYFGTFRCDADKVKPDVHPNPIIGTVSADKIEQYHAIENMFAEGTLSLDEALRKVGGWLNGKPEVIDGVYVAHYQVGNYFGTFRCDADKVKPDVHPNPGKEE